MTILDKHTFAHRVADDSGHVRNAGTVVIHLTMIGAADKFRVAAAPSADHAGNG